MSLKVSVTLFAGILFAGSLQAGLITVGGDQTAGTGTLTLNQGLSFSVTQASSSGLLFVFDEVVSQDDDRLDIAGFSGLTYSIVGEAQRNITGWADNWAFFPFGNLTAKDGYLVAGNPPSLALNDLVILYPGTGTMTESVSSFNPWSSGDCDVFMADGNGNKISTYGEVIPEPATLGLLGVAAGLISFYRHLDRRWKV